MITEEQLEAILSMSDLGGMEKEQINQLALAKNLRGTGAGINKMDAGSQIARAMYGIGGAIGDYRGLKKGPETTAAKQDLLAKLFRKRTEPALMEMGSDPRDEVY
jgi:hypothetical protein